MNAELKTSLERARKTNAAVTSHAQAAACIEQTTDYWIHKYQGQPWTIISIDLTLVTNKTTAITAQSITNKECGIYTRYMFTGIHEPNLLVIYSSDKYTETWVHESILGFTEGKEHRILNVQRDDPGELLDLGGFKLG